MRRQSSMAKVENSDDYEEEEIIIFADFQNKLALETLQDQDLNIKLVGIDTNEPILQINSKIFKGIIKKCVK